MSDNAEAEVFKQDMIEFGGFWQYKAGAKYLAKLTSGKVSDVFANTSVVTCRPNIIESATIAIMERCLKTAMISNLAPLNSLCFVGPALGAVPFTYALALEMNMLVDSGLASDYVLTTEDYSPTMVAFPEKDATTKHGWKFRTNPDEAKGIVMVEDVITTGGSLANVLLTMLDTNGLNISFNKVRPVIFCLVNRTGSPTIKLHEFLPEFKIVSVLDIEAKTFDTLEEAQKVYPAVIDAIRPKSPKSNWDLLVNG